MTPHDSAFLRLREANPVPDHAPILTGNSARPDAIAAITDGRTTMKSETIYATEATVASPTRRQSVVAALVVLIAGLTVGVWLVRPPGSTNAASGGTELVHEFIHRLDSGDARTAVELIADSPAVDILLPVQERHVGVDGLVDYLSFYTATHGHTTIGGCESTPAVQGEVIACDAAETSALWALLGNDPIRGRMTVVIRDERIRTISWSIPAGEFSAMRFVLTDYTQWIAEARPVEAAIALSSDGSLATTDETARIHLRMAAEYIAASDD